MSVKEGMPESVKAELTPLDDDFVKRQISILKKKFTLVLQAFFTKYRILYNQVLPTCKDISEYKDEYFLDTDRSRIIREKDTILYLMTDERESYIGRLLDSDIRVDYLKIFNAIFNAISSLDGIDETASQELQEVLAKSINENGKRIKPIMEQLRSNENEFNADDYKQLHDVKFWDFIQPFSKELNKKLGLFLNALQSIDDVTKVEQSLADFCEKYGLRDPEYLYEHNLDYKKQEDIEITAFGFDLWDDEHIEEFGTNQKFLERMKAVVAKYADKISKDKSKVEVLHGDFLNYKDYFYQPYISKKLDNKTKQTTICIVNDKSFADMDLIFTKEGVIPIVKGKLRSINIYQNISFTEKDLFLSDKKYSVDAVDLDVLYQMIQELKEVR